MLPTRKPRNGSSLVRGTILKSENYPSVQTQSLLGARNFRQGAVHVYGVAQPSQDGIGSIITLLGVERGATAGQTMNEREEEISDQFPPTTTPTASAAIEKEEKQTRRKEHSPDIERAKGDTLKHSTGMLRSQSSMSSLARLSPKHIRQERKPIAWFSTREEPIIYINGRPFVLRHEDNPKQNIRAYAGINGKRVEQMEDRLVEDVWKETEKANGLFMVHHEIDDGTVLPVWIAPQTVQTPRQVYEAFRELGHNITYHRIPIASEQSPEDRYVDEYVECIKGMDTNVRIVFSCGQGGSRTTFAMIVAILIRRVQLLQIGSPDPFPQRSVTAAATAAHEEEQSAMAMLRLVYVLEQGTLFPSMSRSASSVLGLKSKMSPRSAIEWALARSASLSQLRGAIMGKYTIVNALTSALDNGDSCKKLLDEIINRCDAIVNVREVVLMQRVSYSSTNDIGTLEKALDCLERYYFLIAFASYVNTNETMLSGTLHTPSQNSIPFSSWLKNRPEISGMLEYLRRRGPRLSMFRPVEDLNILSNQGDREEAQRSLIKGRSGTVLGAYLILKADHWVTEQNAISSIEGTTNYRRIPRLPIHGVAQPTLQGIRNVVQHLIEEKFFQSHSRPTSAEANTFTAKPAVITWVNLREEPLIYINGSPFVLRDEMFTLRNIKSYSGINSARLELIEKRLKDDVINELTRCNGKLLVHVETPEGGVIPVWEEVAPEHVMTLKEIMSAAAEDVKQSTSALQDLGSPYCKLEYLRVPITAEEAPDCSDLDAILSIFGSTQLDRTKFVVNCQVGMGRSTLGTIAGSLIHNWLRGVTVEHEHVQPLYEYRIIHTLLRTIRNGLECKHAVDFAVEQCSQVFHLRQAIEDWRVKMEEEVDPHRRSKAMKRGIQTLKRYFLLIAFQAYLVSHSPDSLQELPSFKAWFAKHQEFNTILSEMEHSGAVTLLPVEQMAPGDGLALTSEIIKVVGGRRGAVLASNMIMKDDHFPGCQKMSMSDRIEGAPNIRGIKTIDLLDQQEDIQCHDRTIYGVAVPTLEAIKKVCAYAGAGADSSKILFWTNMREEPVLYVNGQPYVMRSLQGPLKNLELTGIERDRVEQMEFVMKKDLLAELIQYGGRCLLHEEQATENGGYTIVALWETVEPQHILTPSEVFEQIRQEGYRVDYLRIPITDEQAPIPVVFDALFERVHLMADTDNAIFNCQMGRGRTTTGMVIACMMEISLERKFVRRRSTISSAHTSHLDMFNDVTDESDRDRFLAGEYKIILQLLSVLPYGQSAKTIADHAINACSHVQNLRTAIHDFKLRLEAILDRTSQVYYATMECGLNYLMRYFYLITFAEYLIELNWTRLEANSCESIESHDELNCGILKDGVKFSEWLHERREIAGIASRGNQNFL